MSKRLAGEREVPKFGQVWSYDMSPPMMAVAELPDEPNPFMGTSRRWLFVRLMDGQDSTAKMWVGANGGGTPWFVLDD